jgi:transcriptional regulator with XRE-family HTH domain
MLNERLKNLRLAKGLTLQQVGDVFGISKASISGWESGKSYPDHKRLEKLADLLGTTVQFLISGTTDLNVTTQTRDVRVPFIEWNLLGQSLKVVGHKPSVLPIHSQPSSSAFATRYLASADIGWQAGAVPAGSILIIDPEVTFGPNDTVIAVIDGTETCLAHYIKTPENKALLVRADTNSFMPIKAERSKIIGVVLEWQISAKLK